MILGELWADFAAAAFQRDAKVTVPDAATYADRMLEEFRKRFDNDGNPLPKAEQEHLKESELDRQIKASAVRDR